MALRDPAGRTNRQRQTDNRIGLCILFSSWGGWRAGHCLIHCGEGPEPREERGGNGI